MRICIYGAGAMGTSLGVLLDEMSLDFVTHNAAHAEAMNRDGAIIEGALTKCVKVRAKLPSEMEGQYDIVILAVKQRENHAASIFLKPFLKEDGALVTVQNGLPERELAEVFGKDRVYGCALSWSAETVRPGVVRVTSDTGFHLALGAYGKGERLEELAPLFAHAGTLTVGDLAEIRFAKLAVNASFSTLSAISGLTFYELAKKHRTLSLALIREVLAVAKGCGCEELPLNGHDLFKVFRREVREDFPSDCHEIVQRDALGNAARYSGGETVRRRFRCGRGRTRGQRLRRSHAADGTRRRARA